ncbi:MAG: N-methyl-L-tryptophan oxidase, partial [Planctomycetota bacterium]
MSVIYDAIVLGLGGVGSSTLYHLAASGANVLGIEQFQLAHDRGSSHGETRAIRKAYFEHPSYVPLIQRGYDNWRKLEERSGKTLLFEQGLIEIGPPDGPLIAGLESACQQHALSLEGIPAARFHKRFPGFVLPEDCKCLYEPDGGYLLVEDCVAAYCEVAVGMGAHIAAETRCLSWTPQNGRVRVQTDKGEFCGERLVIAAGAWASRILGEVDVELSVKRKHLHWYSVPQDAYAAKDGSPVFFYETPTGYYYGFPSLSDESQGMIKVAEHSFGEDIESPDRLSKSVDNAEQARVEEFLGEYLGLEELEAVKHQVC